MATEFTHIKLTPQFEEYLNRSKMKSVGAKGLSAKSSEDTEIENKLNNALLGSAPAKNKLQQKGDFTSPFPVDGEESPLYQRIRDELENSHQSIGMGEVSNLMAINNRFNMGTENFSGFSWQKPMGVVSVWSDRQVTPNLFGANWLVQDTFTVQIEAATFLEKLGELGFAALDQFDLGAFAGVTFKRVYTNYHYADSYQAGLVSDFSKLFLPFIRFNRFGMENMGPEEIMKKEDLWTARAGAIVTSPPFYGFSASAGVMAEAGYKNTVSVQNNIVNDLTAEKFRVVVKNDVNVNVEVNTSVQLDFFKILKLTLLNADLLYEFSSKKDYNLGFSTPQWEHIKADEQERGELTRILLGVGIVKQLEPYVVRLDESQTHGVGARGSILLLGGLKKSKTEQVRVIKDQVVKVFFKNYSQSVVLVQDFLSRIFSAAIYKIFKFSTGVKNSAMLSKQVTMEYEATHPQATNPNIVRVENSEQFSFLITQSYEAASTHRWVDGLYRNDVLKFVDKHTTLPKNFIEEIKKSVLRGPMVVESNVRMEKAGFDYLFKRSENEVFGQIALVCNSGRVNGWMNPEKRKGYLKQLLLGKEGCVKSLGLLFLNFKNDYAANNLNPSLVKFKNFVVRYYKEADSITDMADLFGVENTFINGKIQATTNLGTSFYNTFSTGQFRGLGVIDNFKRATGSRTPASIISE